MDLPKGDRIADDDIYLNESYFDEPKEIHKFVGDLIEEHGVAAPCRIADIGCAVGERIHYLQQRFPEGEYVGVDVSDAMIERAKEMNPRATFHTGSVLDGATLPEACDVTICGGVLAIFDDLDGPVSNLVSTVRPGGSLFISDTFNNEPIDVIMRYRRVDDDGAGNWESGWNVFSRQTVARALRATGRVKSLTWHDFRIPFALPKREDVMRTWTIETQDNPHQIVNGAAQILDVSVVHAEL